MNPLFLSLYHCIGHIDDLQYIQGGSLPALPVMFWLEKITFTVSFEILSFLVVCQPDHL